MRLVTITHARDCLCLRFVETGQFPRAGDMNSATPRILVLGDLHNAVDRAEAILTRWRDRYDQAVLLGDYFDDFGDSPAEARHSALWLAGSLLREERIHLLGNHDLAYLFPSNHALFCPGFTAEKCRAITEVLAAAPRDRLHLAWSAGPWLFSHAGLHPSFAGNATPAALAEKAEALRPGLAAGRSGTWLSVGMARGGRAAVGGITWQDWNEEFQPVRGVNQIVGHTPCPGVARGRHLRADGSIARSEVYATGERIGPIPSPDTPPFVSVNWCLDTDLEIVALLTGQEIEFRTP